MRSLTRTTCAVAFVGLACLAFAGPAVASDYVTLMYTGDELARLGYVTYGKRAFLAQVGQSDFYVYHAEGTYAGLGEQIVNDSSPDYMTTGYCIEVLKSIRLGGSYQFDVEDLALAPTLVDASRATDLEKLFSLYAGQVESDDTAAAFQAAIWEIVNETKTGPGGAPVYNVGKGAFTVTPIFGSDHWDRLANTWLGTLASDTPTAPAYALVSARAQDFAWILPAAPLLKPSEDRPVPEPITMASCLLAIGAVGSYVRRRANAKAAS